MGFGKEITIVNIKFAGCSIKGSARYFLQKNQFFSIVYLPTIFMEL